MGVNEWMIGWERMCRYLREKNYKKSRAFHSLSEYWPQGLTQSWEMWLRNIPWQRIPNNLGKSFTPQGSIKHHYLQPKDGLNVVISFQNTNKNNAQAKESRGSLQRTQKDCLSLKIKGHIWYVVGWWGRKVCVTFPLLINCKRNKHTNKWDKCLLKQLTDTAQDP